MSAQPVHLGIFAVDMVNFGDPVRSNPDRVRMRRALHRLVESSLNQAGVSAGQVTLTDHGDCVLALVDAQVSKARLVQPLIGKLRTSLARYNRRAARNASLRLRAVVHAGEILRDPYGYTGEDLNTAFRLLDSDTFRACVAATGAAFGVITSNTIYHGVVKHGYADADPDTFQPVWISSKETRTRAWVHIPGHDVPLPEVVMHAMSSDPAPAELPADIAAFTGRDREAQQVRAALAPAAHGDGPAVCAISGTGGVGKSALAVRVAHALASEFPDGQLYVDLQGATPGLTPLPPLEVLGRLLRGLGVDPAAAARSLEEATARYRSHTSGLRLLVVLDNATDLGQVSHLLPAGAGCAVIVTSRRPLASLPNATALHLDALSPEEAVTLLGHLAGPERIAADRAVAQTLARQCGLLPLALRIAGARLAARPGWPLRALADQLADERQRLDELSTEDAEVRASFAVSYEALGSTAHAAEAQRMFRLLGTVDVGEIGIPAAAALADRPQAVAAKALEQLVDEQLLQSPTPWRYRMHDLIHLFAREQAAQGEAAEARAAALDRVMRLWVATARRVDSLLQPSRPSVQDAEELGPPIPLADREAARAWMETERPHLVSIARQAASDPGPAARLVAPLADAMALFLDMRSYWHDARDLNQLGAEVAARSGDRRWQGQALYNVGFALVRLRGSDDAATADFMEALEASRDSGERRVEALALHGLAGIHRRSSDFDQAIQFHEQGLAISRETGDQNLEAAVLRALGMTYRDAGRPTDAVACLEQGLAISGSSGHRHMAGFTLMDLCKTYRSLAEPEQAISYGERSLAISRELGSRTLEGIVLIQLGQAYRLAGREDQAISSYRESLAVRREVGDRGGEAEASWRLGEALMEAGSSEADEHLRNALRIFEELQEPEALIVQRLLNCR